MLFLACTASVAAAENLVPAGQIGAVASVARTLARGGHGKPARALVKWVVRAGVSTTQRQRLEKDVARLLDKAKALKVKPSTRREVQRLKTTAAQLAARLPETPNDSGKSLARLIVALDSSQPAANRMLGRELVGKAWVPTNRVPLLKRRGEIADVVKRAHKIEVKLKSIQSNAFARIGQPKSRALSWGEDESFVVNTTTVSEAAVRRVMTDALRAAAVSNWLWTGELAIPIPLKSLHVCLCDSDKTYEAWVRLGEGRHPEDIALDLQLNSCNRLGRQIYRPQEEVRWVVTALDDFLQRASAEIFGCEIQPVLYAGHLHWLCLSYLHEPGPWYVYYQGEEQKGTAGTVRMTPERKKLMGLKRESLKGMTAWMMYLANGLEDPPWQKAIQDQLGKIQKDDDLLLKAASMATFLQETGEFNALARKTRHTFGNREKRRASMLKALGRPFGELERAWRDWLLPSLGVAQRLTDAGR